MPDLAGNIYQQATLQDRKTSSVKRHLAVTMPWLIAESYSANNHLTFDVLRMTWVGITGLPCFARCFLAVACIVTKKQKKA